MNSNLIYVILWRLFSSLGSRPAVLHHAPGFNLKLRPAVRPTVLASVVTPRAGPPVTWAPSVVWRLFSSLDYYSLSRI